MKQPASGRRASLVFFCLLASVIGGCGPNLRSLRQYLATSPHRSIALFPADQRQGQKDCAALVGRALTAKLRSAGFTLADPARVSRQWKMVGLVDRTMEAVPASASAGAALGVQAVLIGTIDEAYDRTDNRPAVYEFETIPPRACCSDLRHPCAHQWVYDPLVQANVDNCGPTHRRILVSPAAHTRASGLALRVRLVDAGTGAVLWESGASDRNVPAPLTQLIDRLTDELANGLVEAYFERRL